MKDRIVYVLGSGLMGCGIAQVVATAGYDTYLYDISEEQLLTAKKKLKTQIDKLITKGKLTSEKGKEIINNIKITNNLIGIKNAYVVIEAVTENIHVKKDIFIEIDKMISDSTIVVSNTSSLSISEIASVTKRPEKIMGMHFFYPAPAMRLVELIRGLATSKNTYDKVREFAIDIGKEPVDAPDLPGFIVNRLLVPMINEGIYCVMEGAKPEDVDKAMRLGANFPMGPLELCDFVGLDIVLATMEGLYSGFADPKYRPCPLLKNMVKAGLLGRKTGNGFYNYK